MSNSLAKGFLCLTLADLVFLLSGYLINFVLGRYFGPENYGVFGLIVTLFSTVMLVFEGTSLAVSKYVAEDERKAHLIKKQALLIQSIIILALCLVYFLAAPGIAFLLKDESLIGLIRLSTLIFPFYGLLRVYLSYYNGLHLFEKQALLRVVFSVLKAVFVLGFAFLFYLKGAIFAFALSPFFVLLLAQAIDPKKKEKTFGLTFKWQKIITYALPLAVFVVIYDFFIHLDLFMVKAILKDNFKTGLYNAAVTLGRTPYYFLSSLSLILLPAISRATAQADIKRARYLITQSLRFILMLLIPAVLLISATSENLLKLFYSLEYVGAAQSMSIFVFGVGFLLVFLILTSILNGAKQERVSMSLSIFGLVVCGILNYFLISKYELKGAALSTLIAGFLVMLLASYFIYRKFKRLISPKSVFFISFCSLIIYFIALKIKMTSLSVLPILAGLFLVYFLLLYLTREIKKEDLKTLKEIIFFRNK